MRSPQENLRRNRRARGSPGGTSAVSRERKGVGFERREQQRAPELALFFVYGGVFLVFSLYTLKEFGGCR